MTEKAFKQMMSGLKEAKDEYGRTVFPDCRSKYYAVRDAIELLKKQEPLAVDEGKLNKCVCGNEINRYWHPEYCGFCGNKLEWY